jgi:quinol monooxygenase YgiN
MMAGGDQRIITNANQYYWKHMQTDEQLQWIVEFSINRGKKEEFQKLAKDMSNIVRRSEPGTGKYEWFLNDKGNKCIVIESYNSSTAGIAHAKGEAVTKVLPQILKVAKISRFEVCGNPSKELLKELADVNPGVYRFIGGFTR